jgi:hypothetical protein
LSNLRVCLPSLDKRVHTLMAKSCSFGSGDIRDSAKRSYSDALYRSADNPLYVRRASVKQKHLIDDYHSGEYEDYILRGYDSM